MLWHALARVGTISSLRELTLGISPRWYYYGQRAHGLDRVVGLYPNLTRLHLHMPQRSFATLHAPQLESLSLRFADLPPASIDLLSRTDLTRLRSLDLAFGPRCEITWMQRGVAPDWFATWLTLERLPALERLEVRGLWPVLKRRLDPRLTDQLHELAWE